MEYYKKEAASVLNEIQSSRKGLSEKEAKNRLKRDGHNELKEKRRESWVILLLRQFVNPLIFVLMIAIVISFLLGHFLDGFVIVAIVLLNAFLGFGQEYKVEKAIELLKKLSNPKAIVIRNGVKQVINARDLVIGDVVILNTGDKVSADIRLIESINLETDESILTGESVPVPKFVEVISNDVEVAEQKNMIFSGTNLVYGRGLGVVVGVGMNTELGKIAKLVQEVKQEETPLQRKLAELSKWLGIAIVLVSGVVFLVGWLKGFEKYEIFLTAVSLAVSAIPEGLPAVVTITLALGVRKMLKRNALVRRIQSIETLGAVSVIASDKTGTLTKNEMSVTELYTNNQRVHVRHGGFFSKHASINPEKFLMLLKISENCNDASLDPELGDPTELALLRLSTEAKIKKEKRIGEVPFDSEKKYMITMHEGIDYIKGAPEKVLELCGYIQEFETVRRLSPLIKRKMLEENADMASRALRVLGMAYRKNGKTVFVGLVGMIDPPRKEVPMAIKVCEEAGIRPIMITGDHKLTAEAIAAEIGISGEAIEGKELDKMSDKELRKIVKKINIYARITSEYKVRILEALQANGEIVAMTGAGINDAPALKKADIGIAMYIKGTDVAREASEIVLRDDNFASIIKAVREGRIIYDNIRKFIKYLLSVNFAEIFLLLCAILVGLPLPLLPLQILWINLATETIPALALGVDPAEEDVMKRKPRDPKQRIMNHMLPFLVSIGLLSFIAMISVFSLGYLVLDLGIESARTMTLSTSILFQLLFVFSIRSDKKGIFELGIFGNKAMVYSVLLAFGLHLLLVYGPLAMVFGLVGIGLKEWLIVIGFSLIGFVVYEGKKKFFS